MFRHAAQETRYMSDSHRTAEAGDDAGSLPSFARAAVPLIIAVASVALVVVAIRSHAVTITEFTAGPDEPTPYSAMESRIPAPPQPEEPPPSF
jgi:hypothetical protein